MNSERFTTETPEEFNEYNREHYQEEDKRINEENKKEQDQSIGKRVFELLTIPQDPESKDHHEGLMEEANRKRFLANQKLPYDSVVNIQLIRTRNQAEGLLTFGASSAEKNVLYKLYQDFSNREIVDTADGLYDRAEVYSSHSPDRGDYDFGVSLRNDRYGRDVYRERAERGKEKFSQLLEANREETELFYRKLSHMKEENEDVANYIQKAEYNILNEGNYSDEAISVVMAIHGKMNRGDYDLAVINYEKPQWLTTEDGEDSSFEYLYLGSINGIQNPHREERTYYKAEDSTYAEKKAILKKDNPEVYKRVEGISSILLKLSESDERFTPVYDRIQTMINHGEYDDALFDEYGVHLSHDIIYPYRLSNTRLNKMVEQISDGRIHFTDRSRNIRKYNRMMDKGLRPDLDDFWYSKQDLELWQENFERNHKERKISLNWLSGQIESLIPGSDELIIFKAIASNDRLDNNTDRYEAFKDDIDRAMRKETLFDIVLSDFEDW